MFARAVFRLTLWYSLALLLVSLLFSIAVYQIASQRLSRSFDRQAEVYGRAEVLGGMTMHEFRAQQLAASRTELLRDLIRLDTGIVLIGALASYFFARRTLAPIQEAHDAQVRFTADASHELRTPLAVLKAEIEVALHERALTVTKARSVLNSNLEEVSRLELLSDELLALTNAESSPIRQAPVVLSSVFADEISRIERKHGVTVQATITRSATVMGNEPLLRQLIGILLENAIKYAQEPQPKVVLRVERRQIVLVVADNGTGIPSDEIPRIFERFYRGRNVRLSGHGLGLSIVKAIVDRHQATISLKSKLGEGTEFEVRFPKFAERRG